MSRPPRRPLVKHLAAGATLLAAAGVAATAGRASADTMLNATIPGSGNTLNLTLGQLRLG